MLSLTCTYAIRALTFLATQNHEETTMSSLIAAKTNIPLAYLSKILLIMKDQGILESLKGPGGGFYFVKKPDKVFLDEIVTIFDPDVTRTDKCIMRFSKCHEGCPCPVHDTWGPFRDRLHGILKATSILSMAEDVMQKRAFLTDKKPDKPMIRRKS